MCYLFNSNEESLHLCVCKLAKYVRDCVVFWKNLHSWTYFYTSTVCDGRDKFQVCDDRDNVWSWRGGESGNEAERGITSKRGHGTNKSSEMVTYRDRIVRSLDRFFWWGAWCWWQKWWWLYNEQDLIFPPHEITVVASHPILHHHIVMLEILYQLFTNLIAAAQCCGCENCQTLLWTWTKWPGEKVAFFGFFDV